MNAVPATFDYAPPSQVAPGSIAPTMVLSKILRGIQKVIAPEWDEPSPTTVAEPRACGLATVTEGRVLTVPLVGGIEKRFSDFGQQLRTIARREVNWDGADGRAPSADAVRDAEAFLLFLHNHSALPHTIFAPGDGEINFEWKAKKRFTEIGFLGDGAVSWYHRDDKGEIFRDEAFDCARPDANIDLLHALDIDDGISAY